MRVSSFVRVVLGVATLLAASGSPAHAAPIVFPFTVTFTSGSLSGQRFPGSLSVEGNDCTALVGLCTGSFTPDGSLDGTLLSFDITINGDVFTRGSDEDYPNFPRVEFINNVITLIDFLAGDALEIDYEEGEE